MEKDTPLRGGNITGVIRAGEIVHRAMGPWSPTMHSFLRYLESQRFEGAPKFLGIDAQGREMLSFIEGEVGNYSLSSYMWSDENVIEVARFLRRYHDATIGFVPPVESVWQFKYEGQYQHEVICHNDVAPYNMIYRGEKPYALIDFDTACPGPRIWDSAYAVYRFIPLSYTEDMQALGVAEPREQARRLQLFCQAYDLRHKYEELLSTVERRLEALCALLLANAHIPTYQKLLAEGHLDYYKREITNLQRYRPLLERCLS
jgi:hypothetical protein